MDYEAYVNKLKYTFALTQKDRCKKTIHQSCLKYNDIGM